MIQGRCTQLATFEVPKVKYPRAISTYTGCKRVAKSVEEAQDSQSNEGKPPPTPLPPVSPNAYHTIISRFCTAKVYPLHILHEEWYEEAHG